MAERLIGGVVQNVNMASTAFEVPNLDGYAADDLRRLEYAFGLLAAYAGHKAAAIGHRRGGDIEAALAFEKAADTAYAKLPGWARW